MYEQPPARRRIGPGLIAVLVVLALAAGTGAYLLVGQVLADRNVGSGTGSGAGAGTNPSVSASRTASVSRPPVATPTGPQTTPKVTAKPDDPGTVCPAVTVQAVAAAGLNSQLTLLRYVEATQTGASGGEAWICKNAAGTLFYQGHRKSGAFDQATSTDTILIGRGVLGKVDTEGTVGFVAVNPQDVTNPDDPDHTEYHVSATAFYYVKQPEGTRTDLVITRTLPKA